MFHRYTEWARRAVFYSRHEASEFGSPKIESHHLLLGLLREFPDLLEPQLGGGALETICKDLLQRFPPRVKVPTSVDVPLSHECKRVLAYADEESEMLRHDQVDGGHLALGLLREERSEAAAILRQHGIGVEGLRLKLAGFTGSFSREDLYTLVNQIPPERTDAAARILEALCRDVVTISITGPGETFELSFGSQDA
jgi:ATP-dependent Clp protease ATP-binding subunit ClpC